MDSKPLIYLKRINSHFKRKEYYEKDYKSLFRVF